ncbi:MAG: LysR family transcriptional regulator [Chloroflexi bacterium]|nr:LysR family transcriptional regulator [Chloroflexota bacterium]
MHQLRVFKTVADLRSFTRAAETLHLSQPAVSHLMKGLAQAIAPLGRIIVARSRSGPRSAIVSAASSTMSVLGSGQPSVRSEVRSAISGRIVGSSTPRIATRMPGRMPSLSRRGVL